MRLTLSFLTIILILFTSEKLFSQNEKYPYSLWGKENLELINSQKEHSQLTEEEKTVVVLTNFVRINPKLFAATFLSEYLDSVLDPSKRNNSYVKSLIKDLNSMKKLSPLELNQNLINMALDHATNSGKKGVVGHTNFSQRFKKFNPKKAETYGENCDYGNNRGVDAFMSLLIDEDVSNLGHRKNILNQDFFYFGVGFAPHTKFGSNMVMEFSSRYFDEISIHPKKKNKSFFSNLFGKE